MIELNDFVPVEQYNCTELSQLEHDLSKNKPKMNISEKEIPCKVKFVPGRGIGGGGLRGADILTWDVNY